MATQFMDRIAVEVDGDGDAVVCLHGLGGTSNTWTPLMTALERNKTIRIDLPGCGRSDRYEGQLSIELYADRVLSVCERLQIDRFYVVAHSLGTLVAFHLAVGEPRRLRGMVLFGPLLGPAEAARSAIRARAAKARSEGPQAMADIADSIIASNTSSDSKRNRALAIALVRESLMRQTPDGYARACDALANAQPAAIDALNTPTLLITGDEDLVAPPQSVRSIHESIRDSRMIVYPRCGHWTPFERPEECTRDLREFLSIRH